MCQYRLKMVATIWHLVHLAQGQGGGLVIVEASA